MWKNLKISKLTRRLNWYLHEHLLYHFAQRINSEVIYFDQSFTLLQWIIILTVIVRVGFIWYLVRWAVKNMEGLQQRSSGFDGIITCLANGKMREGRTACKGIFMREGRTACKGIFMREGSTTCKGIFMREERTACKGIFMRERRTACKCIFMREERTACKGIFMSTF